MFNPISLSALKDCVHSVQELFHDTAKWKEEEEKFIKGSKPIHNFVSRQHKDPSLPPSAIPGDIWFIEPAYKFGDLLIEEKEFPPFYGTVVGMQWDEYEWEYTIFGDMGTGIEFKESEVMKFNPTSVQCLTVFFHAGEWVFDAPEYGLDKEPFVAGMDMMISRLTVLIPNAKKGFKLLFSHSPFPDCRCVLEWQSAEQGGNVYHCPEFNMTGWLCPALFHYFNEAPPKLYVKAEPIE